VQTLALDLPLTTGESTLPDGACGAPAAGPPPCECGTVCTGDACVLQTQDSASGALVCLDARGGVSQSCCTDATGQPGFQTPILRVGRAEVPALAWPNPSYPKKNTARTAGTFCVGATGAVVADTILGLPGPAAVLLPTSASWNQPSSLPCDGGGPPPAPY